MKQGLVQARAEIDRFKAEMAQEKQFEQENADLKKYKPLLKLYDQAEIINDLV